MAFKGCPDVVSTVDVKTCTSPGIYGTSGEARHLLEYRVRGPMRAGTGQSRDVRKDMAHRAHSF